MTDYSIGITIRNARILRLMQKAGINSVLELCRAANVGNTGYAIVNLKIPPMGDDGNWRISVIKIAEVLNCLPEEMFSESQKTGSMKANKRTMEMNEAEVALFLDAQPPDPELLVYEEQKKKAITKVLFTLSPRERVVLNRRFGLSNYDEQTLDTISKDLGVGRERIRQIESKALRKLKHPKRCAELREFI